MIKAIFFDANGVLYTRARPNARLRGMLDCLDLKWPGSEALWQATKREHHRAMLGLITRDDLYDARLYACGVSDKERLQIGRRVMAEDDADIVVFNGVAETLRRLQAKGLTLGIITNSASPTPDKLRWFRSCGLDLEWAVVANSCELGFAKPSVEIYEQAMQLAGVASHESIFVGHTPVEIDGAKAAGMRAIMIGGERSRNTDVAIQRLTDLLEDPRTLV